MAVPTTQKSQLAVPLFFDVSEKRLEEGYEKDLKCAKLGGIYSSSVGDDYNKDLDDHRHPFATYKATRVQVPGVEKPINANWISPSSLSNRLIITDAPLVPKEIVPFWQTAYHMAETTQSGKIAIVMIGHTNEKNIKWDKYWPPLSNKRYQTEDKCLTILSKEPASSLIERRMTLQVIGKTPVTVQHYQFHTWKDGTDDASVESLGDLCFKLFESKVPVITHCSAGIHRAAVFATCYIAITKIAQEYDRDVSMVPPDFIPQIVRILRDKTEGRSPVMLGRAGHYVLIHKILAYISKQYLALKKV